MRKLTEDDVRLIYALIDERNRLMKQAKDLSNAKIAEKFEVDKTTIGKLERGEIWTDVLR